MASEFDKLLEDVAREVEKEAFAYKKPIDIGGLLKRRLLGLLEAGQAMRDRGASVKCIGFPNCDGDLPGEPHSAKCVDQRTPSTTEAWDKQKQAALEGK